MDLRLTLYLGQMESASNISSFYTSICKSFKNCKLIATLRAGSALEIQNHIVNIFATNNLSQGLIAHVTEYVHELQTLKDVRVD
jgi:hypothetical protein